MAHNLREGVGFARLQRLVLDDQVVVAGSASARHQVDADRRGRAGVVGRGELVDDRRDTVGGVLRRLRVFRSLGWDQNGNGYGHVLALIQNVDAAGIKGVGATDGRNSNSGKSGSN